MQRSLGIAVIALAVLAALIALSVNRLTDGAPTFGATEQLVLALAIGATVVGIRLATASWEATAVAAIVAAPVIFRLSSTDDPLQEAHGFRQTQTAYAALVFSQDGIDLLHPGPPVMGPPFQIPIEFPLFQALAVAPLKLELPSDAALRLTGLACFISTSLLLYGFTRYVAGRPAALAALVLFVASPFALLWSRTSMIEYLATAGAVGFAWMTIRWREDGRPVHAALALAAGCVGLLVKPTTAVFWILPALAWRTPDARTNREWLRSLLNPVLLGLVAIPVVLALLWTHHADAIKAMHEVSNTLTSDFLKRWNFGTLDQREDLAQWWTIGSRFIKWMAGPALLLLPVSTIAAWRSGQQLFWLAMAGTVLLPVAVFFNLYVAHDYYQAAISPGTAAVLGLGAGWAWTRLPTFRARRTVLAGAAVVLLWVVLADGYWKAQNRIESPAGLVLSGPLKRATHPDELVLVIGQPGDGWNPDILYYARRKGLMLFDPFRDPDYVARLSDRYHVVFDGDPAFLAPVLSAWPWVGAIEERTYAVGDHPGEISGSGAVATSDSTALPADARALSAGPRAIRCGDPAGEQIPAGPRGTWLRIEAEPGTLIWIDRYSPVPARGLVAVAPGPRTLAAICTGGERLVIRAVLDGAPPVECRPPRPYRWPGCARSRSAELPAASG